MTDSTTSPDREIDVFRTEDGFLIDTDSGEVLEWPEGITAANRLDYLIARAEEAGRNERSWKSFKDALRRRIGADLDRLDARSYRSPYGTARWQAGRESAMAPVERVPEVAEIFELAREDVDRLMACVTALDVGHLEALRQAEIERLREAAGAPDDAEIVGAASPLLDAIDSLIVRTSGAPFVMIDRPRPAPPDRVKATAKKGQADE